MQAAQKWHADKCRHDIDYKIGDQVLLSTRNLRLQDPRRMQYRFVGPFAIAEKIGKTAYCLDLTGRCHRQAL